MKVLILDKRLRKGKAKTLREWKKALVNNEHEVKALESLENLSKYNQSLKDYDVIIAHPTNDDARTIREETKRRKEFRVIVNSGTVINGIEYGRMFVKESPQCCYVDIESDRDKFVELVENGWDKK